jgi:outer membrane biosynthesis protein TonB
MTEFRVSGRSDLDAGEAENGRSDAPMDVAMEMATTATSIATETAGATIFEPMERNENRKRRKRSEAQAAPSDWKNHMERTIQQQAQELTKLHRTVGHLANLVKARAACEEAQRLAMMTWMQEREPKWDARSQDNKVWGAGITNMIAKTMKGVAQGQEEREREREATARMDGGGLEASQHADTTREEGPEERQQPQQQQPKPKPKLQPKRQPVPKPKSAPTPTPARRWETVPPRGNSLRAPVGPGLAPTARSSMAERRLILRRDQSVPLSNKMDQEIASAINRALFHQKAPAHIRIMNAKRNARGAITAITHPNATAWMAVHYRDIIITAARTVDKGVVDVEEKESWQRLKIHTVPLIRYMGKGTEGLEKMREEFETENEGIVIPTQVRWLANPRTIRERRQNREIAASSVVFVVTGSKVAQSLVKKGIKAAGVWY